MAAELTCINKACGKEITIREKKLNAGLCNGCFRLAIAHTAREIGSRNGKARGSGGECK